MISLQQLPALNAFLNATSACLLLSGYIFIRRKNILAHKVSMFLAFVCSNLFLLSYLYYHAQIGSKKFEGVGPIRTIYFSVLISHTILAALVPPLAIVTLYQAWKTNFVKHVKLARITFPIWMYVSITGVIIYFLLYQL